MLKGYIKLHRLYFLVEYDETALRLTSQGDYNTVKTECEGISGQLLDLRSHAEAKMAVEFVANQAGFYLGAFDARDNAYGWESGAPFSNQLFLNGEGTLGSESAAIMINGSPWLVDIVSSGNYVAICKGNIYSIFILENN